MEFQKIVEELLDENVALQGEDKKKGIIAANFTTKTGLYASAQTGTSAGVLAPQFSTATVQSSRVALDNKGLGAEYDIVSSKKTNAVRTDSYKNAFKPSKGSKKSSKNSSKGTIIKYKPVDFGGKL